MGRRQINFNARKIKKSKFIKLNRNFIKKIIKTSSINLIEIIVIVIIIITIKTIIITVIIIAM
jgi:hypothetical protein